MRIKCQVEVLNRNANAASQGIRCGSGKSSQATLFLARKPGDLVFLIYCTAKDKEGVRYKVNKNIQQIFGKFINEGKATVRLVNPFIDICISKAEPAELNRILKALKVAHCGNSLSEKKILSSLTPAKTKHVEKPKTKLVIASKQEYIKMIFPISLEKFHAHDCSLIRVDPRLLELKRLTLLDLSENKLKTLPPELSDMESLCQLNVASNQISEFPSKLCLPQSNFCKNLRGLNIRNNQLQHLPANFHNLKELWQLEISFNSIQTFPKQFGRLQKLRKLIASNNCISFLPFSFTHLNLETLDLYLNPFTKESQLMSNKLNGSPDVLSLQELSAKVVRKNNIFYNNHEHVPYFLINYLNSGSQCPCGRFCFESKIKILTQFDLSRITFNLLGMKHAPVNATLCSTKCHRKYAGRGMLL